MCKFDLRLSNNKLTFKQRFSYLIAEKAMVNSLSSLMKDSSYNVIENSKSQLPPDILLLLDLACGPTTSTAQALWANMQTFTATKGKPG